MAEGGQDTVAQAIAEMRADMAQRFGAIEERLGNIERPPRRAPLRQEPPVGHEPLMRPRNLESDEEEEPPDDRRREQRGRGFRQDHIDPKLTLPTFAGRVDPDAYLDWEKRMDRIFECYEYSEPKKVAVAAAQLTDHALTWWDREVSERRRNRYDQIGTWAEMKFSFKRRYVPPHFHREIQRRFRRLTQGLRSVEEYYDEFESLKNRLELDESEESLMAQFVDGLQDRISRKIELQPYHQMDELLHLAIQIEQQGKRKAYTKTPKTTPWVTRNNNNNNNNNNNRVFPPTDRAKSVEVDSRFKGKAPEAFRSPRADTSKSNQSTTRNRDIICFKCQGRGHMARECPNAKVMILTKDGGYETQDESGEDAEGSEEDVEYPEGGELLMLRRVLSAAIAPDETAQRENIFYTKCLVEGKM